MTSGQLISTSIVVENCRSFPLFQAKGPFVSWSLFLHFVKVLSLRIRGFSGWGWKLILFTFLWLLDGVLLQCLEPECESHCIYEAKNDRYLEVIGLLAPESTPVFFYCSIPEIVPWCLTQTKDVLIRRLTSKESFATAKIMCSRLYKRFINLEECQSK